MDILSTLINAVVGMSVVFAVLVILMLFITIMSKIMKKNQAPKAAETVSTAAPQAPTAARGSCGEVMLFDVPDKTAAQLMAITAEKLGKPLNTLRFVSIKEVK